MTRGQAAHVPNLEQRVDRRMPQKRIHPLRPRIQQRLHGFAFADSAKGHCSESTQLRVLIGEQLNERLQRLTVSPQCDTVDRRRANTAVSIC